MRKILVTYNAWSYLCEKDHFALKEERQFMSTCYRNNLHKIKRHLEICSCGKECRPIKVEVIVKTVN